MTTPNPDQRAKTTITLLSGVTAEIQELTGAHEKMLTKGNNAKGTKGLEMLLKDCLISLGGKTDITDKDIQSLLSVDRKKLLIEIRQFSNEYDPAFKFTYEWPVESGAKVKEEYDVNFSNENFKERPYYKQWASYADIEKEVRVTLPRSGKIVQFTMLTVEQESKWGSQSENDLSSHTMIEMRRPVYIEMDGDKEKTPSVDLSRIGWKDINFLRKEILDHEGYMDTMLVINHPTNPAKTARVDLISLPAFFFPSLAI